MSDSGLTYKAHLERRYAPSNRPQMYRATVEIFKPGGGGFMVEAMGNVGQAIENAAQKCVRYGLYYEDVRYDLEDIYTKLGEA